MDGKGSPAELFWSKYRGLASRLKKRFLKKPNVADVAEEFSAFAKRLGSEDHRQLAGICSLAVARCEQTMGNLPAESEALLTAARLFLRQEEESYELRLPTFDEHVINSVSYFNMATNVYLECKQPHLASGICLEIASALKKLGKVDEAVGSYLRAADIESKFPLSYLQACRLIVACFVEIGDYEMALNTLFDMDKTAAECGNGDQPFFSELKSDIEVSSLLLLLILQYPETHLKQEHVEILRMYTPGSEELPCCAGTGPGIKDDRTLLLQSLVLAVEMKDYEGLKDTETQLVRYLTKVQRDILRHLVVSARHRFHL